MIENTNLQVHNTLTFSHFQMTFKYVIIHIHPLTVVVFIFSHGNVMKQEMVCSIPMKVLQLKSIYKFKRILKTGAMPSVKAINQTFGFIYLLERLFLKLA